MTGPKNVFVVGLDEHNRMLLEGMPDAAQYRFHAVFTYEEIYREVISFDELLTEAQEMLDAFDGSIDSIIGFWDFPVTALVALLRPRYGLAVTSLTELLKCEHKYWSRLVQQEVIEEYPPFALVDLDSDARPPEGLHFPMWIKPVKSFASMLAFGVADEESFGAALAEIRDGIGRIARPFEELLQRAELPARIAAVGGQACLVEEAISGRQVTVEGYRHRGEIVIYGIVDSIHYDDSPSFLRYQYPSTLPENVQQRLADISARMVEAIGLEGLTFNIEFFWDPGTDAVTVLEINPRHSQSHAELFADVDGTSNHELLLRLSLGLDPVFHPGQGRYRIAGKCFLRHFTDGIIRRHPSQEEVATIERLVPATTIDLTAHTGDRLSHMHGQDSYSYQLASIYIGAEDEAELMMKYDQVATALPYEIEDVDCEDDPDRVLPALIRRPVTEQE